MATIKSTRRENHSEDVLLSDTLNFIEIQGDSHCTAFFDQSQLIALELSVGDGTVDSLLIQAGATNYEESLKSLRETLNGNIDLEKSLSSQLELYLNLFVQGQYRLDYLNYPNFGSWWGSSWRTRQYTTPWNHSEAQWCYPSNNYDFVYTQPTDLLNQDTVEAYLQSIRNGQNPIVLTVSIDRNNYLYVVDGHHKLEAYSIAEEVPVVINLSRIDGPRVELDTVQSQVNLFPDDTLLAKSLRNLKADRKRDEANS